MAAEINKNALYIYRLTFGNTITAPTTEIARLQLEQGVRKEFADKDNSYYLTLRGIKINRKIYQPTEIEAELDFMQITTNATGTESTKAPKFEDVSALLLQRQVKVDILQVDRIVDTTRTLEYQASYNVAKNCYVYELNPQLKRDANGTKMYVKMSIFSMDKLMTLNKYSKAYVARRLGSEILLPESLTFGIYEKDVPLVATDISGQKFLKYDGDKEFIQPYLVQYNESFYDFMVRTSNRCGEFLYFEDGKLTLGLPDSGDTTDVSEFESVTVQSISADPLVVNGYARDGVKDKEGYCEELNQAVIAKDEKTGYPEDAFPGQISSNAELAHDDYIFPLFKEKFTNIKREMYYDGSASEVAMSKLIPFSKTMLENEKDGAKGFGTSVAKALIVGEGILLAKAALQVSSVDEEKGKKYLTPLKDKKDQYSDDKAVQFGTLSSDGWTTLNYYEDIHKHEDAQMRQIICINMGTALLSVKLGEKIKIAGMDSTYVIIQIQQISEEAWSRDYDKYDTMPSDKYTGKRSLKIYAIPAYEENNQDKFIPPVQPVPVIRKSGPQTAFVTANEDPKFQGRVRIAFPWQSLKGALRTELKESEQKLKAVAVSIEELEKKKADLLSQQRELKEVIEQLKKYVNATPEERQTILEAIKDKEDLVKKMQDAAEEHDKKDGKDPGYTDLEKHNSIIRACKQSYDKKVLEFRETSADIKRAQDEQKSQEEHREKVAALFDKEVNDMATPWVRIATPMATPGGGTFFRPRVGDEVLVNFDNDNVERPYVVGSFFSKNTLTPDEGLYRKAAPELQWKNISMAMMSPNGHHITFTDPGYGGSFFTNCISPGLGFWGSVLGFNNFAPDAKDLAGGIHIGDRYGLYEIEMKSHKRAIDIRSPFGTVNINAFSGITISAPNGNVTIKGKNITLEAGNKINLLSGKNIAAPGIGDPEGTANKAGKVITDGVGAVLGDITDKFVSSVVDFSLIRHVVEVFVRPVDGTLKLKSKRYLMLEAGKGNATIRRDRYAKTVAEKKESKEEFFKAMLICIKFISEKVDGFYDTYETLWKDGHQKRFEYKRISRHFLKDLKKPNLAEIASKLGEWKDDTVKLETFNDCFEKVEIYQNRRIYGNPILMYEYVGGDARAYCQAACKLYIHMQSFLSLMADSANLELGDFDWLKPCVKQALNGVNYDTKWYDDWSKLYGKGDEKVFLFEPEPTPADDHFAMSNKKIFKRRVLLSFIDLVSKNGQNQGNKYITCGLTMDKVMKSESLKQEYYWNRTVLYLDRSSKLQNHNFWRTVLDNTVLKVWDKLKSNFAPFDRDIWNDKADGQILFSDQENSTLNFEGEGVHQETSSNIGTLDHLKKELMAIK